MMGAGLERDIGRGAARGLARLGERHRLGMGAAAGLRPAPAEDAAVLGRHDYTAHGRIGRHLPQPARGQREGMAHVADVVWFLSHGRCLSAGVLRPSHEDSKTKPGDGNPGRASTLLWGYRLDGDTSGTVQGGHENFSRGLSFAAGTDRQARARSREPRYRSWRGWQDLGRSYAAAIHSLARISFALAGDDRCVNVGGGHAIVAGCTTASGRPALTKCQLCSS